MPLNKHLVVLTAAAFALPALALPGLAAAEIVQTAVPADVPTAEAVAVPDGVDPSTDVGAAVAAYLEHCNAVRTGDLDAAVARVQTPGDAELRHARQKLLVVMLNEALELEAFGNDETDPGLSEPIGVVNADALALTEGTARVDGSVEVTPAGRAESVVMVQTDVGWQISFESFAGAPKLSDGIMPFAELQASAEDTYVTQVYPALLDLARNGEFKNRSELLAAIKMLMQKSLEKRSGR